MDKNGTITISYDTWKNGIQTPYIGMGDMLNIEMFEKPGIIKLDYAMTKVADSTDLTTTTGEDTYSCCSVDESSADAVCGTNDVGQLIKIANADSTVTELSSAPANVLNDIHDVTYWKGYHIFVTNETSSFDVNAVQITPSFSVVGNFESVAKTPNTGQQKVRYPGAVTVGIDDVLYVGVGNIVASLTEDTDFDPSDSGTYTWNATALDLPENYEITKLVNFTDYLMIVAINVETNTSAIFPWDRVSASFDYPTILNNGTLAESIAIRNLLYFLDGDRGSFKVTNRSNVEEVSEFMSLNFPDRDKSTSQTANAIEVLDDTFFVGVSSPIDGASAYPVGIYKVKGGAYTRLDYSEGFDGQSKEIAFNDITRFKQGNLLVCWENDTDGTFGIDEYGLGGYRATTGYIESPLYQLGTKMKSSGLQQVDINLVKPLVSGDAVNIYKREKINDSWTLVKEFGSGYAGQSELNSSISVGQTSTIQFKIELTTGANSTSTPEIINIIFS